SIQLAAGTISAVNKANPACKRDQKGEPRVAGTVAGKVDVGVWHGSCVITQGPMRLARFTSYDRARLIWVGVLSANVALAVLGCATAPSPAGDEPPPPPCDNASILEF